jgi:peptidoglycan/xylan/chitin deacetylase (PgdA/CDA1 family)
MSPIGSTRDAPDGWTFDSWGQNLAVGRYLKSGGLFGGHALRVEMSRYRDGDAKWSFRRVRLAGDAWYSFSDFFRSAGRSRIVLSYREAGRGGIRNRNIGQADASGTWSRASARFYLGPAEGEGVTVYHLIDGEGFLETARPALVRVGPRPLPRPLASLAFDDGWKSALTRARSDLESHHLAGSYYLVETFLDDREGRYASTADLRRLITEAPGKGHEIGSHTAHHRPLSRVAEEARRQELQENIDWLANLGVSRPGLSYPFGDSDAASEAEVRALHPYARTSLDGLNDGTVDRYRIKVFPVTAETATASLLARIDDAVRTSTWLVLLFHDIGESNPSNPYRTSRAQFLDVLDRLSAGDITVVTVADALKEVERSRDPLSVP